MTAPLFTLDAVLRATGGTVSGLDGDTAIRSVSIDSRELGPDALFVAIKGDRFDGHDFVDSALTNGAVAALVSRGEGPGRIVVADALAGLRDLARAARERNRGLIVGVTGSVGKTTTKEALRLVFEAAGQTHASIKSFNNHWGVPLMLARLPGTAQFGVFEMGMSAPDEIRPLSQLVRPHIALITAIAPAHLERLGSLEAIARAKAEIFEGLEPGGTAIINADHAQLQVLTESAAAAGVTNLITYGFARGVDWQIETPQQAGDKSFATLTNGEQTFELALSVPGRHMLSNAAAAFIAAQVAGIDPATALRALAGFGAQPGRGQRLVLGTLDRPLVLIDESYNANAASMRAALEVFAGTAAPGGRKVLVLGDMLELGGEADAQHAGLADAVRASGPDRVILVGRHVLALAAALPGAMDVHHVDTAAEAITATLDSLAYGDAVMVKGSNGVGLARVIDALRARFGQS